MSAMRRTRSSIAAVRHGPADASYCDWSSAKATSEVEPAVIGWPRSNSVTLAAEQLIKRRRAASATRPMATRKFSSSVIRVCSDAARACGWPEMSDIALAP